MTHVTKHQNMALKSHRDWRQLVGNFLLVSGFLFLTAAMLGRIKILLAAELQTNQTFLVASSTPLLVLPSISETITDNVSMIQAQAQDEDGAVQTETALTDPLFSLDIPLTGSQSLTVDNPAKLQLENKPGVLFLPVVLTQNTEENLQPPSENEDISNGQVPKLGAGPVVRLVIPSINVDRAVIEVGLKKGGGNQLTWNTDMLFSTNNRSDLVGQASTSVNPGDGGNIILIGHNYNNGWYSPEGVFVNIHQLKPGSKIMVYTRDGSEFRYEVRQVKKVPWREQNGAELEKHHKFLWPTENEQLTLVTCGGANFGIWSARVYVVAVPLGTSANQ
jgi:LPXTG-site transpeptidase (sortase) family protein